MSVPFDLLIWDSQDCADYFKESRAEFLRSRRHKPGFPPELSNAKLRWSAVAVTAWALQDSSPEFTQKAA